LKFEWFNLTYNSVITMQIVFTSDNQRNSSGNVLTML